MIFYATPGQASAPPIAAVVAVDHAATQQVFRAAAGPPTPEFAIEEGAGEKAEISTGTMDVQEQFDWSRPRTQREFIRLEQQVLADRANSDEQKRYRAMKRDRNGWIFAERYVRDYSEVQRLRKLTEKLADIQQYLRPIKLR
jgi:hypothetical protein